MTEKPKAAGLGANTPSSAKTQSVTKPATVAKPAETSSAVLNDYEPTIESLPAGFSRRLTIPEGILNNKLLSNTSHAQLCFMHQRFSRRLQMYLVMYVTAVTSYYAISAV